MISKLGHLTFKLLTNSTKFSQQDMENNLLQALDAAKFEEYVPHRERVFLPQGKMLYTPHAPIEKIYFPTTSIISLIHLLEDGSTIEVGVIGYEGLLGLCALMKDSCSPFYALVQNEGHAWSMPYSAVKTFFDESGAARRIFLDYVQVLMMQVSQTAVCRGRHTIDQQFCRWLLLMLDRLKSANELQMTHDLMATMLGVRRESISRSAYKLQQAGAIRYVRGRIDIIDRLKIEEHVCECYGTVKLEFSRMLDSLRLPPDSK